MDKPNLQCVPKPHELRRLLPRGSAEEGEGISSSGNHRFRRGACLRSVEDWHLPAAAWWSSRNGGEDTGGGNGRRLGRPSCVRPTCVPARPRRHATVSPRPPCRLSEANVRAALVAAPGCVLLSADYRQIELHMLAHFRCAGGTQHRAGLGCVHAAGLLFATTLTLVRPCPPDALLLAAD